MVVQVDAGDRNNDIRLANLTTVVVVDNCSIVSLELHRELVVAVVATTIPAHIVIGSRLVTDVGTLIDPRLVCSG
jgi:hypothetical protein